MSQQATFALPLSRGDSLRPTLPRTGAENRDHYVCVDVRPGAVSREMLAARVSLITSTASGAQTLGQGSSGGDLDRRRVLSTSISRHIAHDVRQAELAQAIQDELEAHKAGDDDTAAAKLSRAVAHTCESCKQGTIKVVGVVEAATGTVRLKARVTNADEIALDIRSSKAIRVTKQAARKE